MSSPILHIKDSYFFEVPKAVWRSYRTDRSEFPDFWVALDDEYLQWESGRFAAACQESGIELPKSTGVLQDEYSHWLHADHANAGKPFQAYLESTAWFQAKQSDLTEARRTAKRVKTEPESAAQGPQIEFDELTDWFARWDDAQAAARDVSAYRASAPAWSEQKIEGYNDALNGKILIPQPLGELRNLHEPASGFCISKYMIVQLLVAALIAFVFIRLANRMRNSDRPQGKLWNMLEAILLFLRNEVARPAIGQKEGDRFVPLLWTIFLFILGMNLSGMIPWVGAPTSAFAVTLGMAVVTLLTGIVMGSIKFGPLGFWANQIPSMDLHWSLAIFLKPMIWIIEVAGMLIKHAVLGVRLLANMVAGHVVLLGILGIAFSVQGAQRFLVGCCSDIGHWLHPV